MDLNEIKFKNTCQCITHPRGSGVCVTRAAHRCAEGTSECSASTDPPSLDASMLAESSGQSESVYLPGRREGRRAEGGGTRRRKKKGSNLFVGKEKPLLPV